MQSNSDSGMTAAMVAALANRRPQANDAPSQNLMRAYLDKLKELVPMCPKNKSISKLELIQHVIDYINELQDTLQNDGGSSPPPSPTPDPISFSEAFSQLCFAEPSFIEQKEPLPFSQEGASACCSNHSYTSDGSSDYDSRGSSPVNSHSDTDYSSDDYPIYSDHHRVIYEYNGTGTIPKVANPPPQFFSHSSYTPVYRNEQKRHYSRREFEYPVHHTG